MCEKEQHHRFILKEKYFHVEILEWTKNKKKLLNRNEINEKCMTRIENQLRGEIFL
jgi:hypothetical protein